MCLLARPSALLGIGLLEWNNEFWSVCAGEGGDRLLAGGRCRLLPSWLDGGEDMPGGRHPARTCLLLTLFSQEGSLQGPQKERAALATAALYAE